jgi:hypothetical protein
MDFEVRINGFKTDLKAIEIWKVGIRNLRVLDLERLMGIILRLSPSSASSPKAENNHVSQAKLIALVGAF